MLDSSSTRTTFLRNALQEKYGDDFIWPQAGATAHAWIDPGRSTARTGDVSTGVMDGVDIRASQHSEGEPSTSHCNADSVRHAEVSLSSMDTPERTRTHDDRGSSKQRGDMTIVLSPRLGQMWYSNNI